MTLEQSMRKDPWTWKDWIAAVCALLGTGALIGTTLMSTGRMLEAQDATNRKLTELSQLVTGMQAVQALQAKEITQLQGHDALRAEQIKNLERRVDEARGRRP